MPQYAHINDAELKPQRLPRTPWRDPQTGITHHLYSYDDTRLAALGWYPVRREELEEGATGWGEMYLDDQTNEFVIPSLPADPAVALKQRWLKSKRSRKERDARKTLASLIPYNPTHKDIQARIDALNTLTGAI
jgi:hypothetical protein